MLEVEPKEIAYEIDGNDRFVHVNKEWDQVAHVNHASELLGHVIVQHSLWDFIVDRETRMIYGMMLERVRKFLETISFSYRCDTPTQRRFMQMELQPRENDSVRFVSQVVRKEDRPYTPLLDPLVVRSKEFITICSWCKQVELADGRWVEVEEAVEAMKLFHAVELPQLSHGMCASCADSFRQQLGRTTIKSH